MDDRAFKQDISYAIANYINGVSDCFINRKVGDSIQVDINLSLKLDHDTRVNGLRFVPDEIKVTIGEQIDKPEEEFLYPYGIEILDNGVQKLLVLDDVKLSPEIFKSSVAFDTFTTRIRKSCVNLRKYKVPETVSGVVHYVDMIELILDDNGKDVIYTISSAREDPHYNLFHKIDIVVYRCDRLSSEILKATLCSVSPTNNTLIFRVLTTMPDTDNIGIELSKEYTRKHLGYITPDVN